MDLVREGDSMSSVATGREVSWCDGVKTCRIKARNSKHMIDFQDEWGDVSIAIVLVVLSLFVLE